MKPQRIPPPIPDDNHFQRRLASLLDTCIKVPGTNLRIGLDPIIGLVPGIGDALAAALGSLIVIKAMESGAPRMVILRMTGNLLINAMIGAIPLVGDLFSAWFHSNARNYAMLTAWQAGEKHFPAARQTKWVAGGCVLLVLVLAGLGTLAFWLVRTLWHMTAPG